MTCPSGGAHYFAMALEGNIMTPEAWRHSMERKARCMICGRTVQGYEAGLVMRKQRQALEERK